MINGKKKLKDFNYKRLTTFKINEFITLKLENNSTNIYVKGVRFNQCKYLLLNISTKKIRKYE